MNRFKNNIVEIEKEILSFWQDNKVFNLSMSLDSVKEYVFYDGPPFANGLPHYGHLLTGYIKDAFGRYHTMLNQQVSRRFGWDCHGLPAEMGAEKDLKISGRKMITQFGIDKFNEYCKTSVLKYTSDWVDYVNRQGRWVDFENDYKTMDISYMESVIWAFKELYDKGLIYKSERVMPYSWACETPVSDFETKIDNAYRQKASKSVTLKFTLSNISKSLKLALKENASKPVKLLVWTTTPWTLPSNLALAVGKDIEYRCFITENEVLVIAKALAENFANEIDIKAQYLDVLGSDIENSEYFPIFDYFKGRENAFNVLTADFVSTEDGTGIVHIAPGFGEDDYNLCKSHGIEIVCPVDDAGKFTSEVTDYFGIQVFQANDSIIQYLKDNKLALKVEQYLHNYPHCWRTDEPLIYKAVPSWHLKVTSIKDQMIENNKKINWIPSHVKSGLFGKWLENARDWSISRNRFWGCPIPVWQSDDPNYPHTEVYGSIEELEKAFGVKVDSLHRPDIDNLVKKNPSDPTGKSNLVRVQEVFDCWFESGSMPFAQVHYPFENKDWFEKNFPADFIAEYVAQTRGWFYTLMVLSTALFNKTPFLNCICHGVILGDGKMKLSKRLKNYADPNDVFSSIGADPMRWYMLSSNVMKGQEIVIDKEASGMVEASRSIIKPMLNSANFFIMYSEIDKVTPKFNLQAKDLLNRYILSKILLTSNNVVKYMNEYDTVSACNEIAAFIDVLNNWYIRRSREKFWSSDMTESKSEAYDTLYTALEILCKISAPLLPFTADYIYKHIGGEKMSVHLEKLTENYTAIDEELILNMDRVRDACTTSLSIRNDAKIRIRQPLAKVTFIGVAKQEMGDSLINLVLEEANVKEWDNLPSSEIEIYADFNLKLKLENIAKRLPQKIKEIIPASKRGDWIRLSEDSAEVAGVILRSDEFSMALTPKKEYADSVKSLASQDGLVMLDLDINEKLINEGIARDFIRFVQQSRKDFGFNVIDRIELKVECPEKIFNAIDEHKEYIKESVLAVRIERAGDLREEGEKCAKSSISACSVKIEIAKSEK